MNQFAGARHVARLDQTVAHVGVVVADHERLDRPLLRASAKVFHERLIAARIFVHRHAPAGNRRLRLVHLEADTAKARINKVGAPRHYQAPDIA